MIFRAPKCHLNIMLPHSGSKAQDKEDSRKHGLRKLILIWLFGPQYMAVAHRPTVRWAHCLAEGKAVAQQRPMPRPERRIPCRYVCMYVYVCIYVWMYVCLFVCMYVCMYICMYVFIYTDTYTYVYMHACISVCLLFPPSYLQQHARELGQGRSILFQGSGLK